MDDSPDYHRYSLEQLYDVARHIDREKYPDRYAALTQEIARKEQTQPPALPSRPASAALFAEVMMSLIFGGALGCMIGAALGYAAMILLIITGPASARNNLDAATGLGGIMLLFALVCGVIGAIKGANRALK